MADKKKRKVGNSTNEQFIMDAVSSSQAPKQPLKTSTAPSVKMSESKTKGAISGGFRVDLMSDRVLSAQGSQGAVWALKEKHRRKNTPVRKGR